jgi:hypothetical protein
MKRVLGLALVACALGVGAYACSNDTFESGDASVTDASDDLLATFCGAEQRYATYCGLADAACVQANLASCGTLYSTLSPAFAQAIATCIQNGTLACSDPFADGGTCLPQELVGYTNDGGAFATLAVHYCQTCDPLDNKCPAQFGSGAGLLASLFSDPTITLIDNACTKKDSGVVANDDSGIAALNCAKDFLACEATFAAAVEPGNDCNDH